MASEDAKRKRGLSSSSSTSSIQISKKKTIDDQLNGSVFSIDEDRANMSTQHTHTGGATAHSPHTSTSLDSVPAGNMSEPDKQAILKASTEFYDQHPESHSSLEGLLNLQVIRFEASVENLLDRKLVEKKTVYQQEIYDSVMFEIQKENDELKNRLSTLEDDMEEMKESFNNQMSQLFLTQKKVIDNENQMRKYNMKIYGLKEFPGENLKAMLIYVIFHKLKLRLHEHDIEVIHRLGKPITGKTRPVVCKFQDRGVKYSVMMARRMLKNTGIFFDEDLCRESEAMMKDLKDHRNIKKIWSWNGKVFAIDKNDKKHILGFGEDWVEFFDKLVDPQNRSSTAVSVNANSITVSSPTPSSTNPQPVIAATLTNANSTTVSRPTPMITIPQPVSTTITNTTVTSNLVMTFSTSGSIPAVIPPTQGLQNSNPTNPPAHGNSLPQPALPPPPAQPLGFSLPGVNNAGGSILPPVKSLSLSNPGTSTTRESNSGGSIHPPTTPPGFSIPDKSDIGVSKSNTPNVSPSRSKVLNLSGGKSPALLFSPNTTNARAHKKPPQPTRIVGNPQITFSPRAASNPTLLSPLARAPRFKPRTPKNQPMLSTYFGGKPAG